MKKNLITIIIFALVLVNLVLTAILTITIVPETKKANELITKVCTAIDLDLQAGEAAGSLSIPVSQIVTYDIPDSMTINLKDNGDGNSHYAVITVTISMDSKNEDYGTYAADGTLSSYESLIKSEINTVVSGYTVDQLKNDKSVVETEILSNLQTMFASDFIIGVSFSSATYQ